MRFVTKTCLSVALVLGAGQGLWASPIETATSGWSFRPPTPANTGTLSGATGRTSPARNEQPAPASKANNQPNTKNHNQPNTKSATWGFHSPDPNFAGNTGTGDPRLLARGSKTNTNTPQKPGTLTPMPGTVNFSQIPDCEIPGGG